MWFIKLLKSAMAILSNMSQQTLFRRTWSESSKRLYNENRSPVMKIMGKVSGHVSLSDLGKNIAFGQIVELTESDITRSKDLQDAIRMKWVDVIENRSMILRAPAVVIEQKKEEMNKEELMNLAKEMAKTMVQEVIKSEQEKNSTLVEELKHQINDLKESRTVVQTQIIQQTTEKEKIKLDDQHSSIFIDLDEKDKPNVNLNDFGTVKEEKVDLSSSLEKMKRFRRKP